MRLLAVPDERGRGWPAGTQRSVPRASGQFSAADAPVALVVATQCGDVDAFGCLYDRYAELIFRYALARLGNRSAAEDVTSETFLRALRRIDTFSDQGRDVGAWLVTITRNIVLDHFKCSRTRLEVLTAELPDADDPARGPEPAALERLAHEELLRCVRQLSDDQQECIMLRFLRGLTIAETAELMGRKEAAVKALQHRAVRRLAALLPASLR